MLRSLWSGGELATFSTRTLPLSISDPKVIRWHTTSFSFVGELVDLDFFGLRRRRLRDIPTILVLTYVASLKVLGFVPEAVSVYRSLSRRRGRLGAFGWIGLGDLTHTFALWRRLVESYDAHGLTLFPLFNGVDEFLADSMGWEIAVGATFDAAREFYDAAVRTAPEFAFPLHEQARLEADAGNAELAAEAMTAFAQRLRGRAGTRSQLAADLEAARVQLLASAPDVNDAAARTLRRWHEGPIRLVSTSVAHADDASDDAVREELDVRFSAYWRRSEHLVEKKLVYDPIRTRVLEKGFVSAYVGAPHVTEPGDVPEGATTYSSFPGREIFSPLFLGSSARCEAYVARTTGSIRDAVVLPGLADNYFHFLFDTVGALAHIDASLLDGRRLVVFAARLKPFQREILELLGIRREQVHTQRPGRYAVSAKNVVVVDFPTRFAVVHPRTVPFLRQRLVPTDSRPQPQKRIYLERTGTRRFPRHSRRELHRLLAHYGFAVVHPETLTVREQIALIADAEAIAVDAGAGASNLLFAPRGAKVFLLTPMVGYMEAFTPICTLGGLELHVVLSDAHVHPKYLFTWSAVHPIGDAETLEVALERAFSRRDDHRDRYGAAPERTGLTARRKSSYERK